MILLFALFSLALALAAIVGLCFVESKIWRGILAVVIAVSTGFASFQAGTVVEFQSVAGTYNRPFAFVFQKISQSIAKEDYEEASEVANEMVGLSYIQSGKYRKEHAQKIVELTQ